MSKLLVKIEEVKVDDEVHSIQSDKSSNRLNQKKAIEAEADIARPENVNAEQEKEAVVEGGSRKCS